MQVVSIANFILLASSVRLCALRPNNIGVACKGEDYAFRLAFHANAASLEYSRRRLARTGRGDGTKRTPHAMAQGVPHVISVQCLGGDTGQMKCVSAQ